MSKMGRESSECKGPDRKGVRSKPPTSNSTSFSNFRAPVLVKTNLKKLKNYEFSVFYNLALKKRCLKELEKKADEKADCQFLLLQWGSARWQPFNNIFTSSLYQYWNVLCAIELY